MFWLVVFGPEVALEEETGSYNTYNYIHSATQ